MVGDRLDTDIKLRIDGGLGGTLLVLTGVSQLEDLQAAVPETIPSAYTEKLSDLCVK
jgi:4-nitrophenyl phosphatase